MTRLVDAGDWTAGFALKLARKHSNVRTAALDGAVVRAVREHGEPVRLVAVDIEFLDESHIIQIMGEEPNLDAIVNIKGGNHVLGTAKAHARRARVAALTAGETMAALGRPTPLYDFEPKELVYLRGALANHNRVDRVSLVCELVLRVHRTRGIGAVDLAVSKEYLMSAEAVEAALKFHPNVHAIVNTNPYGRPTSTAVSHARARGIGLFTIRELFGALNANASQFSTYDPR